MRISFTLMRRVRLPMGHQAHIPRRKVTEYLLADRHPQGRSKARYFRSRGYRQDEPELLEVASREIATGGEVVSTEASAWGMKYITVGEVVAADGRPMWLEVVWIVEGSGPPSLVTAYPARGVTP